jgi:hypothetical protein
MLSTQNKQKTNNVNYNQKNKNKNNIPTEAGWHSVLFSLTKAAAVTCAIINPELNPPSFAKNAGSPLK